MDSSTHQSYQIQNSQPNSGLLRFCSAPSSLLANSNDNSLDCGVNKGGFGSDRLISLFMNSSGGGDGEIEEKPGKEAVVNYANSQPSTYSGLLPHIPRQSSFTESSSMYGLYKLLRKDHHSQGKSVTSSLMRPSSSLPGVLTNLSVQNGYASSMEGLGNYCGLNGINGELSPSSNRLKNQNSFSSRTPSSLGILSQVSEIGKDNIGTNSPNDDINLGNNNSDARFYGTGYHYGSWNNDWKFFNQNEDLGSRFHILSHHLSLPRTSNEMVAMEKFLHFQDPVPCKMRAKRGCATHPRSIAERVRRTRISERMRKIQELVPNMDKQTNTADMLDLAVEYIKDLQKQFKTLSDNRANCKCSNIQKQIHNQIV